MKNLKVVSVGYGGQRDVASNGRVKHYDDCNCSPRLNFSSCF